jgi:hypothetical protein
MPTINTPKQMPTGDGHPTAGNTINDLDFPTTERDGIAFATLRAGFALRGHHLYRSNPSDGPTAFWVERWGLIRHLPTIDAARRFLEQIGGRL